MKKAILVVILITLTILIATSCGANDGKETIGNDNQNEAGQNSAVTVDFAKLVNVDFGKYDGYSTPTATVNYDYLESLVLEDVMNSAFTEGYPYYVSDHIYKSGLSKLFYTKFDKDYNNIKNGDKITVQLLLNSSFLEAGISISDVERELNIDINDFSKEYIVSGLEEPKNVVDLLADVEDFIVYDGADDKVTASIVIPDNYSKQFGDIYVSGSVFSLNIIHENTKIGTAWLEGDREDLKEGDTFDIYIDSNSFCEERQKLDELGYFVPTLRKTITVPDLGKYLTSADDITPEILNVIKETINTESEPDEICEILYGKYKPGIECRDKSTSFIVAIVKQKGMYIGYNYGIDEMRDIIIKPDGSISCTFKESKVHSKDTFEQAKEKLDYDSYDFEIIEAYKG